MLIMEGLTAIAANDEGLSVIPRLARYWQFLSPHRLLFKIRNDVKWTDGSPLVARHFTEAWKTLLLNAHRTPYAEKLFCIVGARSFAQSRKHFERVGVKVIDAHTLLIQFVAPTPDFPRRVAHPSTFPLRHPPGKEAFPVTLGPFVPEQKAPAAKMRYQANALYTPTPPTIEEIVFMAEKDPVARIALFVENGADLIDRLSSNALVLLPKNISSRAQATSEMVGILAPKREGAVATFRARTLLEESLDRSAMLHFLRWPHVASTGLSPPTSQPEKWGTTLPLSLSPRPTFSGVGSSLNLDTKGIEEGEDLGKFLQAHWARTLGVSVRLDPTLDADLKLMEWSLDPFSAGPLETLLAAAGDTPSFGGSLEQWESHLKARERMLLEKRMVLWPLYFRADRFVASPRLTQAAWNPAGFWDFSRAELN